MERRRLIERILGFRQRQWEQAERARANIDAIPQDEEIVLSEPTQRPTYETNVPKNYPLPNPFMAGFMAEDVRRQREAEHELGE